jgi:hypothetical protein
VLNVGTPERDSTTLALEAEQAIKAVIEQSRTVELTPQNSHNRRAQHALAERYNVGSRSRRSQTGASRFFRENLRTWFRVVPVHQLRGGRGSGKSTQIRLLADDLQRQGFDVVVTREPGGTTLGERVRDVMFAEDKRFPPLTMAFLLAASRHELVQRVIRPAPRLAKFLCDRFVDSTLAYQAYGQAYRMRTCGC